MRLDSSKLQNLKARVIERKRSVSAIFNKFYNLVIIMSAPKRARYSKSQRHSQASTSKLSQSTLEEAFNASQCQRSQENIEELVNNCVRFVIYRAGSNLPIRKSELQEHIFKGANRTFEAVIGRCMKILQRTYGYKLQLCPQAKQKTYIVSNNLPYVKIDSDDEGNGDALPKNIYKVLIMLVLTHVFMSNDSVTEGSLYGFLRALNIDPDKKHETFGNVKDFINVTMVKQKYLEVYTDKNQHTYSWGVRSEAEISKHELLQFVADIYKNSPQVWKSQLEEANKQNLVRNAEVNNDEEMTDT